jgi:hypothetical protein
MFSRCWYTNFAALAFGGDIPPLTAATEEYDGTSWTTSTSKFKLQQEML